MSKATYYVEVDTYWQNSASYFVGPFASRDEANTWIAQESDNVWLSTSLCGGDIRDAWRVYAEPLSKTAARKRGLRRFGDRDEMDNELPTTTKQTARALSAAAQRSREIWS